MQVEPPIPIDIDPLRLKRLQVHSSEPKGIRDIFEASISKITITLIALRKVYLIAVGGNEQINQPITIEIAKGRAKASSIVLSNATECADVNHV